MRLIDANALLEYCNNQKHKIVDANDIARFPTAVGWISVEDRLPETSQEVLIFSRTEKSGTGYMNIVLYSAKFKAFNATDDCDEYKVKSVTHWMPLPNAPEE